MSKAMVDGMLGDMRMDERVDVLEGLKKYFGTKIAATDAETEVLDQAEATNTSEAYRLEGESQDLRSRLTAREMEIYATLWRYEQSLRRLGSMHGASFPLPEQAVYKTL